MKGGARAGQQGAMSTGQLSGAMTSLCHHSVCLVEHRQLDGREGACQRCIMPAQC
jgi:hypothetical protein